MTNNEAAKWIQIFIDETNRDLIEEFGLCLSEKTQKMMKAIEMGRDALTAQPETAKRIVGKSRDGMTLWYQCDMCNEPVDAQDNFCRGCGRRLTDG